jgi:hypothetical protein
LQQPLDDVHKEADYAIKGAELDPYNESPWRYLIGLIKEDRSLAFEYESKATQLRTILTNAGRDPDECHNLTSARIDLLEMQGDADSLKLVSCCRFVFCCCSLCFFSPYTATLSFGRKCSSEQAIDMAQDLATKHDLIRKKYWLFRVSEMRAALE